jgi:hypothetical protein
LSLENHIVPSTPSIYAFFTIGTRSCTVGLGSPFLGPFFPGILAKANPDNWASSQLYDDPDAAFYSIYIVQGLHWLLAASVGAHILQLSRITNTYAEPGILPGRHLLTFEVPPRPWNDGSGDYLSILSIGLDVAGGQNEKWKRHWVQRIGPPA